MLWMNFSDGPKPQQHAQEEKVTISGEAEEILGKVMPYGVSLLLHVGLLLIIVFATISIALEDPDHQEKLVIPLTPLSPMPGTPRFTIANPTSVSSTQNPTPEPRSPQLVSTNNPEAFGEVTGTGAKGGGGPGSSAGRGKGKSAASLFGQDGGFGQSGGDDGAIMFDPSRGGTEFQSSFIGVPGGNAVRIVYLIDASGTLIETLPFVVEELKRSIGQLSEKQKFSVIFFQGTDPKEALSPGLKNATPGNRTKVFEWIDSGRIIPQGGNNPVKAIQMAMAYKPELIYILSDNITGNGIYQVDQRSFVEDVVKAAQGRTKICTIQFITQDPLEKYGMKPTLRQVSDRTGGIYKFLDSKELGIE